MIGGGVVGSGRDTMAGGAMKKTDKIAKVMGEFKRGTLHGGVDPKGPKKAPVVKSRAQAIAVALSKAGKGKKGKK